eukprot:TRINITY_DN4718_c0_g1_i1.p2 TRINITY_DN4718_c0_g1~~TRINITY_DN4718_c0_g1_i1.p2  ORF type:complete len:74 (-),score=12.21 TRINITY_DN4718_c0_g1_i1:98-319(-)
MSVAVHGKKRSLGKHYAFCQEHRPDRVRLVPASVVRTHSTNLPYKTDGFQKSILTTQNMKIFRLIKKLGENGV